MKIVTALFAGILFFLLTPNILLRLPKNGNKTTVAGVHAVVFTFVLYFFNSLFHRLVGGGIVTLRKEGFFDEKCTDNGGNNDDDGLYYLKDINDPNSCTLKN